MSFRTHGTSQIPLDGFSWKSILDIFRKFVVKIQVSLKHDKNNGTLQGDRLAKFFLEWELFQTEAADKTATYIFTFNNFFSWNRALYEIMWKNTVEPDRPEMTIWRMRITCWITKATNIHSEYAILIAFSPQKWLNESSSALLYTYIACLFHTECYRFCVVTEGIYNI
jgi:hypothetical protein